MEANRKRKERGEKRKRDDFLLEIVPVFSRHILNVGENECLEKERR